MTQGVLGAALAAAVAPPGELRAAAVAGLAAGMLADADVLISSPRDPLLALEYHRHFSHALVFIPIGAIIAASVLWPLMARWLRFPRLLLYCLAGYSLSGLLDACTGYGTHLLWPFSQERTAWNLISIVDPLFTLALAIPLALALRSRAPARARAGLALAALYLAFAVFQHHRAEDALREVATARGHPVDRMLVRPTFGNQVLWRGLYQSDGVIHALAIRAGTRVRIYEGAAAPRVQPLADSPQARFAVFTDGWLIADPQSGSRVGDARYAMSPTALRPMWSLEAGADGELQLITDRSMSGRERDDFVSMLMGRQVPPPR